MNFVGKHGISSRNPNSFFNKSIYTLQATNFEKKKRETTFLGYKTTVLSLENLKNIFKNLKMKICLKINNRRKVTSFLSKKLVKKKHDG